MFEILKIEPRFILIFLLFIALVHSWASLTSAYFFYWWLDMVMHFLGGLWVSLFTYFAIKKHSEVSVVLFFVLLGSAAIIGILWEIMEFGGDILLKEAGKSAIFQPDLADTLSDLFFDLLGGFASYLFVIYAKNL